MPTRQSPIPNRSMANNLVFLRALGSFVVKGLKIASLEMEVLTLVLDYLHDPTSTAIFGVDIPRETARRVLTSARKI